LLFDLQEPVPLRSRFLPHCDNVRYYKAQSCPQFTMFLHDERMLKRRSPTIVYLPHGKARSSASRVKPMRSLLILPTHINHRVRKDLHGHNQTTSQCLHMPIARKQSNPFFPDTNTDRLTILSVSRISLSCFPTCDNSARSKAARSRLSLQVSMRYDATRKAIMASRPLQEAIVLLLAHRLHIQLLSRVCTALLAWAEPVPTRAVIDSPAGRFAALVGSRLMVVSTISGVQKKLISERRLTERDAECLTGYGSPMQRKYARHVSGRVGSCLGKQEFGSVRTLWDL